MADQRGVKRKADVERVVVYTDGSCLGNGGRGARAGVGVFWGDCDPRNVSEPLRGPVQTNNRAELTAILRALQCPSEKDKPLLIVSDSEYSIHCCTLWLPKWKRTRFIAYNNRPVKNRDILEQIDRELQGRDVEFKYVQAHADDPSNKKADELAKVGARMARTT